jgi:hypothetical protein
MHGYNVTFKFIVSYSYVKNFEVIVWSLIELHYVLRYKNK